MPAKWSAPMEDDHRTNSGIKIAGIVCMKWWLIIPVETAATINSFPSSFLSHPSSFISWGKGEKERERERERE